MQRTLLPCFTVLLSIFGQTGICNGQAGSLDSSFNPGGSGANDLVLGIDFHTDGRILIGGDFTEYNGQPAERLARLMEDGTLDPSFQASANDIVYDVDVQPDGKILLIGEFSMVNGVQKKRIARLLPDGSIDETFLSGNGFLTFQVTELEIQADGKILVTGGFDGYAGTVSHDMVRLNTDGTIDETFESLFEYDQEGIVYGCEIQPDGKIIIHGSFTEYAGADRRNIARLLPDGSLDPTFDPGTGSGNNSSIGIRAAALRSDGKIMIGGGFLSYNGYQSPRIARVNADGSPDPTFNPGIYGLQSHPRSIAVQADHKFLVGGDFLEYNNQPVPHFARIRMAGNIDNSFQYGSGPNVTVFKIVIDDQDRILIGGNFFWYDGTAVGRIARILPGELAIGIEEEAMDGDLIISPNPASSYISVQFRSMYPSSYNVTIFTIDGRPVVQNGAMIEPEIDISNLPPGTYSIQLGLSNGTVRKQRFIKL